MWRRRDESTGSCPEGRPSPGRLHTRRGNWGQTWEERREGEVGRGGGKGRREGEEGRGGGKGRREGEEGRGGGKGRREGEEGRGGSGGAKELDGGEGGWERREEELHELLTEVHV